MTLKPSTIRPPAGASGYRLSVASAPDAAVLALPQLAAARRLINDSLDVIDVSTWTGDAGNASFIAGQLRLLYDHVQEAKQNLKGEPHTRRQWWEETADAKVCVSCMIYN